MFRRSAASSFVLAALAASAFALDPFGPPFGANRYTTSIVTVDGISDADDYVTSLLAGETLTVSVAANKGSTLLPSLVLVDPDGAVTSPAVVEGKGGAKLALKAFPVTKTGRWGVRVAGRNDTQGAYTIAFKVGAAAAVSLKKQHLGGADPSFLDVAIDGLDGALLDVAVKGSKKEAQVHLGALKDPSGQPVAGVVPVEKPGSATLKRAVLHAADGLYTLRLYIDSGEATCSLSLKLTPQGRPKGKKALVLPAGEPALAPRDTPILGASGGRVRLEGTGFAAASPPAVYFGRAAGTAITVAGDGKSIGVTAPAGPDDAIVSVAVVAADGQASARDAYFRYVPPPRITDLTNAAGQRVRGGSSVGAQPVRLLGTGFEAGQVVRIGNRAATIDQFVSATRIDFRTPPGPAGQVPVTIEDAFGRVVAADFLFEYKAPPTIASVAPPFGAVAGGTAVTVTGANFEPTDTLQIGGADVASTYESASRRTFVSPALPAGVYPLAITDRFGAVLAGPSFEVKSPPAITSVQAIAGPRIGTGTIALGGGATVRVTGTDLRASDRVTLGGVSATVTGATATQLDFTAPAGTAGAVTLTVTDVVGQSSSMANALRLVGYEDQTQNRQPGASSADDLTALRGAMADLDGDGASDDLVIVSDQSSPGSRTVFTRLFFGANSALTDVTAARFPAVGADPQGQDDYRAQAVAIGDLDANAGKDLVIAGAPTQYTYTYYGYTYVYGYYYDARVFTNGGSGTFSFSGRSPAVRTSNVTCSDGAGSTYTVFAPGYGVRGGKATSLAIGDVDGNGTSDIVMATDHYRTGTVYIAPNFVTFNPGAPGSYVDSQAAAHYSYYGTYYYSPGLRVFQNRGASGFVDVTFPRVPLAGTYPSTQPAFHGRDVKLGDLDGDANQSLDIVVTWDDPTTTTPVGVFNGSGYDSPRVSTSILLNDGSGFFTDRTANWMPSSASPEFWQANRVEVADLDGDGDLDLVLLHAKSTNAYQGTPTFGASALRILRNNRPTTGFTDVTASALPAVPLAGTSDDNLRGTALVVRDIDGDGFLDILVGTTDALVATSGQPVRRTRLLRGATGLAFSNATGFLPPVSTDTGEADDLVLGDLAGNPDPSLVLVTETPPATSPGSEALRVQDWRR